MGNGLFKANPSSLLSYCYKEGDPRLDGAFTMYYMAINLGAGFAMLLVPYLANKYGWGLAFHVCTFGLVICILSYLLAKGSVKHIGSKVDLEPLNKQRLIICIVGTLIAIACCTWLLQHIRIAQCILCVIGAGVLMVYIRETLNLEGKERTKMWVTLLLIFEAFLFFILYAQMPTSLNFFAVHHVNHDLFGIPIAPESFQVLNPVWIVCASPFLALIYNMLGKRGRDFSMPMKFALGMLLCAFGYFVLPFAIKTADSQGFISSYWMIIVYGFQSVGELLVSALGLAMVVQFVPKKLRGFIMGAWFLSSSFAGIVAGYVASLTAPPQGVTDPLKTLTIYSNSFMTIGFCTLAAAIIMLLTAPYLTRRTKQDE